jgi:hypothetical protein
MIVSANEEVFASVHVSVETKGNVLAAIRFLHGVAANELEISELDFQDPDYKLLMMIRAVR